MSHKIHKFELPIDFSHIIQMPKNAKILHVSMRRDHPDAPEKLYIWALVWTLDNPVSRKFHVYATGETLPISGPGIYIGTVHQGDYVWHIFDMGEE